MTSPLRGSLTPGDRVRKIAMRRGAMATYGVYVPSVGLFGISVWRRGALSLLAPIGDGVPLQVVIGDWWGPFRQRVARP